MEKVIKAKNDNQYFFKMFRFVKPYALPYSIGMFFYSSQGFAFPFILSIFSGNIMAAITAGDPRGVIMSVVIMLTMIVSFMIMICFGVYMQAISEAKAGRGLKLQLFRKFISASLERGTNGHSGEGIAAINTDADTACNVYGWPLVSFLMHAMNIVFSSIVVFVIDWRLGIAAFGIGFIGFLVQHRFTGPIARIGKERLERNASAVKTASNIFSGAITIRAFNMQPRALIALDSDNMQLKLLGFRQAIISMWQGIFTTVQGWMTLVAVFGLGGWLVATGRLEFHLLVMAPFMCMAIAQSFAQIGEAYANLQVPIAGAKRVFHILEADEALADRGVEKAVLESGAKKAAKRTAGKVAEREVEAGMVGGVGIAGCGGVAGTARIDKEPDGYRLSIDNMSFRYLDAESDVLHDINLEIGENQMVAFVGESGSGKSTLLRAIIGMYEREELGITLGDLCFNESSLKGWRRNFAYVDQSCKLFDMSIKENIAMGKAGKASDAEIEKAARRAAAHDFIEELEGGYDAPCGEKGGVLSGGQKQRIAIARALVKMAPVIVVDEATSALDTESERQVMSTIESLRSDHTILITTHNLENIVSADMIVVLDNGRIAETGTHQELLDKRGLYHRLSKGTGTVRHTFLEVEAHSGPRQGDRYRAFSI